MAVEMDVWSIKDQVGEINQKTPTLRDYFAAKAMQAMLNNDPESLTPPEDIASAAYEQADAMIAARKV